MVRLVSLPQLAPARARDGDYTSAWIG